MKKISLLLLSFVLLVPLFVVSSNQAQAEEEEPYQIYINGQKFDYEYPPIVENNAIYVPMWGLLGKLGVSVEHDQTYDVIRINLPHKVIFARTDSNLVHTYDLTAGNFNWDEEKFVKSVSRADYSLLSKNYIIYIPLSFLSNYMDVMVGWGENNRIDLTVGDLGVGNQWNKLYEELTKIKRFTRVYDYTWFKNNMLELYPNTASKKELKLDALAEAFWSQHSTLWVDRLSGHDWKLSHLTEVVVIGYSGSTVTLSNSEGQYTESFSSIDSLKDAFFVEDPLDSSWPESVKEAIRGQKVMRGMSKEMVLLSWGKPTSINRTTGGYGTFEQYVYRLSNTYANYLYFENGVLTAIQN